MQRIQMLISQLECIDQIMTAKLIMKELKFTAKFSLN